MNDLIRPTLYEAHHEIQPVLEPSPGAPTPDGGRGRAGVRIGRFPGAGSRYCGSPAGRFARGLTAGAYGAVQAGTYNTRPLIRKSLSGWRMALVRPALMPTN